MTLEKSFILSKLLCPHLNNIDNNRVTYRVLVSTPLSLICSLAIMCYMCVCVCVCVFSCLTLWPHGRWPTRLLSPWDFSGNDTGVGCHFLFQGSSWPKDQTHISCVSCVGRQILYHRATWLSSVITGPSIHVLCDVCLPWSWTWLCGFSLTMKLVWLTGH